EVDDGVSQQDEQIETPSLVLPTQEVEVHALIVRMPKPTKIKVFGVIVHTLREAFGQQLRHLSFRDDVELLILPCRVQDKYLLLAGGFLRVRERGGDARRERHRHQRPAPNATSRGQHVY